MINEDYKNKEVKTNHYAYIYYYKDTPICYTSNGKIEFFDDDDYYSNLIVVSEIIDYIEDDCGNGKHNSRKFRNLYLYYDRGKYDCTFVNAHSLKWCPKVINGDFNCSNNRIHSLKGGPEKIDGNFICSHNKLTSLEGAPKEINGIFTCYNNKISKEELLRYLKTANISGGIHTDHGNFSTQQQAIMSLEKDSTLKEDYVNKKARTNHYAYIYYKEEVPLCIAEYNNKIKIFSSVFITRDDKKSIRSDLGENTRSQRIFKKKCSKYKEGSLNCSNNNLATLKGSPKKIDGYFDCSNNRLTSLEGAPEKINGFFDCSYNELTSLKGGPEEVIGSFDCRYNQITSLEGAPKKINCNFNCSHNKISKEELLRYLKTAKIGGRIIFFGDECGDYYETQQEAIEKLSGQIKESYFDY